MLITGRVARHCTSHCTCFRPPASSSASPPPSLRPPHTQTCSQDTACLVACPIGRLHRPRPHRRLPEPPLEAARPHPGPLLPALPAGHHNSGICYFAGRGVHLQGDCLTWPERLKLGMRVPSPAAEVHVMNLDWRKGPARYQGCLDSFEVLPLPSPAPCSDI